uniref:Uncharacterized protein n=1 Tax=Arion vulgaris TaxID=1028688 RepID=A0A0B7B366_9EUPU
MCNFFHEIVAGPTEFMICATLLAGSMPFLLRGTKPYEETRCNKVNTSPSDPFF